MTLDQLKNYLYISDLEFEYNGRSYFICPMDGQYSAGEAWITECKYTNFDDLINNFIVEGKSLRTILNKIEY
jgi:hypothetical protein